MEGSRSTVNIKLAVKTKLLVDWDVEGSFIDEIKRWRRLFLTMHVVRRDLKAEILLREVRRTRKGYHLYFLLFTSYKLTDVEKCLLQAILLDDNLRVLKNMKRLVEMRLGIRKKATNWNILFNKKYHFNPDGTYYLKSMEGKKIKVFQLWEFLNRFSEVIGQC